MSAIHWGLFLALATSLPETAPANPTMVENDANNVVMPTLITHLARVSTRNNVELLKKLCLLYFTSV